MVPRSCDGHGLLEALRAAMENLERHVDEVNGLNVFPVPDGDTGSNMLATVRSALSEAERADEAPLERIAAAISFGALMGARGNSGVITSQIFAGMAEALSGKRQFNGRDFAHALTQGAKVAYGAVARPVEGTILTVVRESASAAVAAAEEDNDLERVLAAVVDAAAQSVARTPSLLPILREAGVVDSGGQGLYRLFQGALLHISGSRREAALHPGRPAAPLASTLVGHVDEGFGYETMYLLQARDCEVLDVDAIRAHLESIGDSVLVAGDGRAVKVHVHNERPDLVIGYGLALGALSRISVENLDDQARDVRESRAAEFAGGPDAGNGSQGPITLRGDGLGPRAGDEPSLGLAVIAVATAEGLARIFREDFGVACVVGGGQSANPSTGELLEAVEALRAREVLILPNNPNVILAARQVAEMASRPVVVVPTRNAAEGYAALLALDPTKDAATNAEPMTKRGRGIQTMAVTEAVRDATIDGRSVGRGHTIVLDPDDGLIASHAQRERAILAAVESLDPGTEIVSIYYGDGADLDEVEALARQIREARPGVEVEMFHGGQPHYRYLIAAE